MRRVRAPRATAALLAVGLAVTACEREPADPSARLAAAASATADGSFSWAVTVDADPDALGSSEDAERVAAALRTFEVTGTRNGDGASLSVSLIGLDVFELRRVDESHLFVRIAAPDLAALVGTELDPQDVVPRLRRQGLPRPVVDAVAAAMAGEWIGVVGRLEADELRRAAGGEARDDASPSGSARAALGGDLAGFIERYLVVTAPTEDGDEQVYDVALEVRALLGAVISLDPRNRAADVEGDLRRVPREVPATVRTGDGVVRAVSLDIADLARRTGNQVNGSVRVTATFHDHGRAPAITAPERATTVTAEQLLEAVRVVAAAGAAGGRA